MYFDWVLHGLADVKTNTVPNGHEKNRRKELPKQSRNVKQR
jgi:hypothetical protein